MVVSADNGMHARRTCVEVQTFTVRHKSSFTVRHCKLRTPDVRHDPNPNPSRIPDVRHDPNPNPKTSLR